MGDADLFLSTNFEFVRHSDGNLSVHLSQQAFVEHTAAQLRLKDCNHTPIITPYRPGCPIDSILYPEKDDPDLTCRTKEFQSLTGSINWLAVSTRPDVTPIVTFLAPYQRASVAGRYEAAIYTLCYLVSTSSPGIT